MVFFFDYKMFLCYNFNSYIYLGRRNFMNNIDELVIKSDEFNRGK